MFILADSCVAGLLKKLIFVILQDVRIRVTSLSKTFIVFGLIAFIIIGIFGLSNLDMVSNPNGQMSGCPFMGVAAICTMNAFGHIAAWQSMFGAVPSKTFTLLAALFLLALFAVVFLKNFWNIHTLQLVPAFSQRFRKRTFFSQKPLQEAFSNGILNPKLF